MANTMAAQPADRPVKHGRILSFGSNKSGKSGDSQNNRLSLVESHKEKEARMMRTHADPLRAMNEMQPSAMALEKSNLESLRSIVHKDRFGNPITDPDPSNPTRHRLERPLDTIRSFEAAIDGTYSSRRMSTVRGDESTNGYSRPPSYLGEHRGNSHNRGYGDQMSYGNRGYPSRPESYVESYGGPSYSQHGYSNGPPRVPRHGGRPNGDPWNDAYGQQHNYQSYDNATSGSGSGSHSMDQLANSTDPSSLNSSMDRLQQQQHQQQLKQEAQMAEAYGFTGFGHDPQLETSQPPFQSYAGYNGAGAAENGMNPSSQDAYTSQALAPPVPQKDARPNPVQAPNKGSLLKKGQAGVGEEKKRKSWFKRLSKTKG